MYDMDVIDSIQDISMVERVMMDGMYKACIQILCGLSAIPMLASSYTFYNQIDRLAQRYNGNSTWNSHSNNNSNSNMRYGYTWDNNKSNNSNNGQYNMNTTDGIGIDDDIWLLKYG